MLLIEATQQVHPGFWDTLLQIFYTALAVWFGNKAHDITKGNGGK